MSKKKISQKKLRQELIKTVFFLLVALVTVVYSTMAWFASNKEVTSSESSVSASASDTNLYIRLVNTDKENLSEAGTIWSGELGLYPISTSDCSNWYYVSDWLLSETVEGNTIKGVYNPSGYALATVSGGLYTNNFGENRRAFFSTTYNLYTDKDNVDVYLNPDNPVVVSTGNTELDKAIRVGLVVDDKVLIFSTEEDNEYKAIFNGTETAIAMADIDSYKAVKVNGKDKEYSAGTTKLCTANKNDGVNITVYVWLEGTDEEAIIGKADSETTGINVTINYAGVEVN